MAQIDAVVIGASAGGIQALTDIVRYLPANLCAAVLVVVHRRAEGNSYLDRVLGREAVLPVSFAVHGAPIKPARIYVAPPDVHLTVRGGTMQLIHGPKENGFRPAIDPLFRAAAQSFGRRLIGVILSGALDDGADGLRVIKDSGGLAVVQDPSEAQHSGMPLNAMRSVKVDHVLSAAGIAGLIAEHCEAEGAARRIHPGVKRIQ